MDATLFALTVLALAQTPAPRSRAASAIFTLDPVAFSQTYQGKLGIKMIPTPVPLSAEKPKGLVKEPNYTATPRYGMVRLGNGPRSALTLVLAGDKLYLDDNANGDLTDETPSVWNGETLTRSARASYGTADYETTTQTFPVMLYGSADRVFVGRQAATAGALPLNGKTVKALLVDTNGDGIYTPSVTSPVYLVLDLKGSGNLDFSCPTFDIAQPIEIEGKVYRAAVQENGLRVTLLPTNEVPLPKLPPAPPLLTPGASAPDCQFQAPDGSSVSLTALRGKVVVLDFWATWCGPCLASFPHLESVWSSLKTRSDVTVLAANVFDEKAKYTVWRSETKFTFPVAFDPAGRDTAQSIARKQFGVTSIPTTFVIGKDGKIVATISGYTGEDDHRLEEALKAAGIE